MLQTQRTFADVVVNQKGYPIVKERPPRREFGVPSQLGVAYIVGPRRRHRRLTVVRHRCPRKLHERQPLHCFLYQPLVRHRSQD